MKPETTESEKENTKKEFPNTNSIFVGKKHLMNYVNSIGIQLDKSSKVIIKARGKFISKAVDIAEVARKNHNLSTGNIQIGTEEYEKESKKINISTIEISLAK